VDEKSQSGPQIVVAFQNYTPPFNAKKVIGNMLRVVPPQYLWGLHSVILTNVQALSRKERDRRALSQTKLALGKSLGYYTQSWKGEPAQVTLLIDNLEKSWGRGWLRFGIIRDVPLAGLLYHEIGHHIHRVHAPKYEDREEVADKWSDKLCGKYLHRQYWYLAPAFCLIRRAPKLIQRIREERL